MPGIKRFITYIYSYENGEKGANTGFAKLEIRGAECRMEIHIRGISQVKGSMQIFLFALKDGELLAFPVGELRIMNRNGDYGTIIKKDQICGSTYSFSDMEGMLFSGEREQLYLTRWTEGAPLEVKKEKIKRWEPPILDAGVSKTTEPEKQVDAVQSIAKEQGAQNQMQEEQKEAPENIQATEVPMKNVFPKYHWPEIWERMKENYPRIMIAGEEPAECVRIELKDLRELPNKYWYLGNNSFLLHGFFNYHYLIIGKLADERWFMGIPGIYQHQERVMASIFGFPDFLLDQEPMQAIKKSSEDPVNQFGYWYHTLDE